MAKPVFSFGTGGIVMVNHIAFRLNSLLEFQMKTWLFLDSLLMILTAWLQYRMRWRMRVSGEMWTYVKRRCCFGGTRLQNFHSGTVRSCADYDLNFWDLSLKGQHRPTWPDRHNCRACRSESPPPARSSLAFISLISFWSRCCWFQNIQQCSGNL